MHLFARHTAHPIKVKQTIKKSLDRHRPEHTGEQISSHAGKRTVKQCLELHGADLDARFPGASSELLFIGMVNHALCTTFNWMLKART